MLVYSQHPERECMRGGGGGGVGGGGWEGGVGRPLLVLLAKMRSSVYADFHEGQPTLVNIVGVDD